MDEDAKELRVDRRTVSVVRLDDQEEEDKKYWRGRTPRERLQAVETTRRIAYGYDPASARFTHLSRASISRSASDNVWWRSGMTQRWT